MKKILIPVFAGLAGGLLSLAVYNYLAPKTVLTQVETAPKIQTVNIPNYSEDGATETDFRYAASTGINAVVHVKTEHLASGYSNPMSYFFGMPQAQQLQKASGSGVIVSSDGFIVTNNHVIANADRISVALNNGVELDAELIGRDPATDLALLKVDGQDYSFLPYGNSDNIEVGQWVLAVGNPFNLQSTVTAGIISAKSRNIDILKYDPNSGQFPIESFIQTDAAVNPGNSGGALIGANGELIGINTAIASNTGSYAGYAFAIPANIVKKVVSDLYEFGAVQRAFIGVGIRNLDPTTAKSLELKNYNGAYVTSISKGGAGEEAGLKKGDVITHVANIAIKNVTELQEQIGKYRPGDKVEIAVYRDEKSLKKKLTLRNISGTTSLKTKEKIYDSKQLKISLQNTDPDVLGRLDIKSGVTVKEIKNIAFLRSGLKEGFIITHIDKKPVKSPEQVDLLLSNAKEALLIEGIYPNGKKAYYGFGS